jgi:hypothetical protein
MSEPPIDSAITVRSPDGEGQDETDHEAAEPADHQDWNAGTGDERGGQTQEYAEREAGDPAWPGRETRAMTKPMLKRSMKAAEIAARLSANVILNIGAMARAPSTVPDTNPYVRCVNSPYLELRAARRLQRPVSRHNDHPGRSLTSASAADFSQPQLLEPSSSC